jgi:hypothetical protein
MFPSGNIEQVYIKVIESTDVASAQISLGQLH